MIKGERILQLRRGLGLTQSKVAEKLGIQRPTYTRYEKGNIDPPADMIRKLADFFDVSTDYLLGKSDNPHDINLFLAETYEAEERIPIPKYEAVKAGFGGVTLEGLIGYEFFDKSSINGHLAENYFCVQIKGDSMAPQLIEGDIVLVKRQDDVDNGQLAVVVINDEEATIKKVKKGRDYIELISSNPAYDSRIIEEIYLEGLHIVGQVMELKRKF